MEFKYKVHDVWQVYDKKIPGLSLFLILSMSVHFRPDSFLNKGREQFKHNDEWWIPQCWQSDFEADSFAMFMLFYC